MMSRQQQVDPRIGDRFERGEGSSSKLKRVFAAWNGQRMMGHYELGNIPRHRIEDTRNAGNLGLRKAPVFSRESTSGVQSQHGKFVVLKQAQGLIEGRDVTVVFPERPKITAKQVVKRNIVISRRNELWNGDPVQEPPGFSKFNVSGPLREIAADDDQIGAIFFQTCKKILRHIETVPSEMQVGNVSDGAHGNYWCVGKGASTRSAAGLVR